MKRVKIISSALVPTDEPGKPRIAYRDSVIDVDDKVAGELVAGSRAVYAKDEKLKDTTKDHEAEADKRAEAAKSPQAEMIGMIAAAVAQAITQVQAQQAKPAGG